MVFLRQSMAGSIEALVRASPRKSPIISPAEALIVPAHIVAERQAQRAVIADVARQADVAADAAEEREYARVDAQRLAHNKKSLEDVAQVAATHPGIMQRARGWAQELLLSGVFALGALGAGIVTAAEPAPRDVGVNVEASAEAGTKIAVEPAYTDGQLDGVANARGAYNSHWHTDMFIYSHAKPGTDFIRIGLQFSPRGTPPQDGQWQNWVNVNSGETKTFHDVLQEEFGREDVGTIHYWVTQGNPRFLTFNGNTYNPVPDGQFGQQIREGTLDTLFPAGTTLILPAPVRFDSYRANMGITAGIGCTDLTLASMTKDGELINVHGVHMASKIWAQLSVMHDVYRLILDNEPGLYFTLTCHDGPFSAAISFVNNVTNDGNNIEGRSVFDMERYVFYPGLAFARGANGSNWQSNLEIANPNDIPSTFTLFYLPRDQDNSGALVGEEFTLGPHAGRVLPNVLEALGLPKGSVGSLLVQLDPAAPSISFVQTPNVLGEDDEGRIIAYGQNIPGVTASQSIQGDLEGVITGMYHNDDFRANALFQNTAYDSVTGELLSQEFDVELLTPSGAKAHVAHYSLRPGELIQENGFVEKYLGAGENLEGSTMIVRARPNANQYAVGGIAASVSVVSGNRIQGEGTGDGRLISHNLIEQTNTAPQLSCLKNPSTGYASCDHDDDKVLDYTLRVSLADLPGRFTFIAGDPDGDSITSAAAVPSSPEYLTLNGLTALVNPGPEHLGSVLSVPFVVYDHHGKQSEPVTALFEVVQ